MSDDQSELIEGTVQLCTHINLVVLNLVLPVVVVLLLVGRESFVRNGPVLNVLKVITIYCPVYFILYQI